MSLAEQKMQDLLVNNQNYSFSRRQFNKEQKISTA
jgi:hypothetical protein